MSHWERSSVRSLSSSLSVEMLTLWQTFDSFFSQVDHCAWCLWQKRENRHNKTFKTATLEHRTVKDTQRTHTQQSRKKIQDNTDKWRRTKFRTLCFCFGCFAICSTHMEGLEWQRYLFDLTGRTMKRPSRRTGESGAVDNGTQPGTPDETFCSWNNRWSGYNTRRSKTRGEWSSSPVDLCVCALP